MRNCGLIVFFYAIIGSFGQTCIPRFYDEGSTFVCVCNATYCDVAPKADGPLEDGQAVIVTSSRASARFSIAYAQFDSQSPMATDEILVNASRIYQTVLGFGGAFTDATGINIAKLSRAAQEKLIKSYFSDEGIEYGIGRVPIAGSDFSTYPYSYDDFPGDVTLSNFSLTEEDFQYKIPFIEWAKSVSPKAIKLFASPWSGPAWMKTNNAFSGFGQLLPEYYQLWAEYFAMFFEEYAKFGLDFWGVTAQNEPNNGRVPGCSWNCMGWNPEEQALFIGQNLGPTLSARGFRSVKIMMLDDQRTFMPRWPQAVLADPDASRYISGIGVHWYANDAVPPGVLTLTHDLFPDRFLLATEACNGPFEKPVIMGSWERLESYAFDIIEDLNHWVAGWVDWNLVLDEQGGPNWANNFVDAPIIINNTVDEFYKQPMFYAMGHFSKYIPEDSARIGMDIISGTNVYSTGFLRPDGKKVIIILNKSENDKVVGITDTEREGTVTINCPGRSIHTVLYD